MVLNQVEKWAVRHDVLVNLVDVFGKVHFIAIINDKKSLNRV